jgi:hypothetical protein
MRSVAAVIAVFLVGCPVEVSDIDTDDDPTEAPDITGEYTVLPLTDVEGEADCAGIEGSDPTWLEGMLTISGPADALTYTFEGGEVLTGSVDPAFTFFAEGTVVQNGIDVDVAAEGLAFIGDQRWILDGDVVLDVLDSTDGSPACTLSGRLEAEQLSP